MFEPQQMDHQSGGALLRFRCEECGYGASARQAPRRCPMCGGGAWLEDGWRPFHDLADGLAAAARRHARPVPADADAPLTREIAGVTVFPGVPLS